MKTLLLASALLFAPLNAEDITQEETTQVEETPTEETQTEDTTIVDELKDKISKLIEDNEWLKNALKTVGAVFGALGGTSFVALLGVMVRAINNSIKAKRVKQETLEDVKSAILNSVNEEVRKQIEKPLNDLTKAIGQTEQLQVVIGKIIALSQEDSYKSRLAILECIGALNIVDTKVLEEAKENIEQEEQEEKETTEEALGALNKVIEDTGVVEEEEEDFSIKI